LPLKWQGKMPLAILPEIKGKSWKKPSEGQKT
jgi:hypothetical protein